MSAKARSVPTIRGTYEIAAAGGSIPMDGEEALRRVKLITPMLGQDVSTAVASHSVMEACNDVIPPGMKGIHTISTKPMALSRMPFP